MQRKSNRRRNSTTPASLKALVPFRHPPSSIKRLPDSKRYNARFLVRSETTTNLYLISFDTAIVAWVCSCPGGISRGQCKHLDAIGLKGRKFGRQLTDARKHGWLS